ncbi:hypothetical protein B0J11DRAFT_566908 [Dendryphion nanum]|uniref:U3 small nucleolar RNA-associated protein 10 n=1 Tax=Dendryphion nanum TaxID=256645 RepID=A0A9P9IPJ1_9PLEO|nr:hypothetical protein B0J11DRAFT_566908 [Dendryphion nanum]
MSSLQKQLAAIAATSTHQLDLKAQRNAHGKSLLFEPKVAASQSFDAIYAICYDGYRNLCALDPRFLSFARTLFSEQSKDEDRAQMNKAENEELDRVLESFITLVGPRLLLKPAEKALEWLVRRFRVHETNTECLVLTYLPYHGTPQFLSLLSILPPNPPPTLRFLHPYLSPPTNPPRSTIVYTSVNTPLFFAALQAYAVKVFQARHQGSSLLSFWASVTTQAIDGILENSQSGRREIQDQKTEQLLLKVLPSLNACLQLSELPEAVMGSYMIIIVLATKASFEDKILDSLLEAVIRSQNSQTLESCLMCMAVLAEERTRLTLPSPVSKRLFKIDSLIQNLQSLSAKCRVERLTLGIALGALDNIARSIRAEESRELFNSALASKILNESQLIVASSTLFRLVGKSPPGSAQHGELLDLVNQLSETSSIASILHAAAESSGLDVEALGITFQQAAQITDEQDIDSDEEMADVNDSRISAPQISPPQISDATFLVAEPASFSETLVAFEQAVLGNQVRSFLASQELRRDKASKEPLYLSFLIRTWCLSLSASTRSAALRAANSTIKDIGGKVDLQLLIPYLIHALADSSPAVRRVAAGCIATLSKSYPHKSTTPSVWGVSDVYGKGAVKLSQLKHDEVAEILSSFLVPILEECAMDPASVVTSIREVIDNSKTSKQHSNSSLKSTVRSSLVSFLGSHCAATPLIHVRLRLLPIFGSSSKHVSSVRTSAILPTIRAWFTLSSIEIQTITSRENIDRKSADKRHLDALVPRETQSINLLQELLSGNITKDRTESQDATFDWLNTNWTSIKSDSRLTVSHILFDMALAGKGTTAESELCRSRSIETLRSIKLDTNILLEFVKNVPLTLDLPEGPPAKRRRRTSRNEIARAEFASPEDLSKLLSRLTLTLEIVESSNPAEHPELLADLFRLLGELQQLKQHSGSELVYLQSLILGSLTPIVNTIKSLSNATEYQQSVRVDLLIDCIRHSTSPQVQNAALLLIASLASWLPELVLHNLMPIFTFIGSTLLKQNDDYSAHVVDQTISQVVPRLAESLRKKDKNLLSGVSDLLLSFTAAFEHIPLHRRQKLFSELARTLGPADSLSAIITLLVDRYPASPEPRKFIPGLLLSFEPMSTLHALKGYLDLVADAASSKRNISNSLFSLNEKTPAQIDTALNHLLTSLAGLMANQSVQKHIDRAFRKARDRSKPQALFAETIRSIIQLSQEFSSKPRLTESCRRVLTSALELLPTSDLIKSAGLLLSNPDSKVQVAAVRAVELRAGSAPQNDLKAVSSLISFIPEANLLLQQSPDTEVRTVVVSCIDRIIERFGKKDPTAVAEVANTIASDTALASNDDRLRILSLLCITSVVDVLEEEAISLLPKVLPITFGYLKEGVDEQKTGLHNAALALLTNIAERLAFMFSREYLEPALGLTQLSAANDLEESCDDARRQFYHSVSTHLGPQEIFAAIKATWSSALDSGYEASREMLELIQATIQNQSKSKMIQSGPILFGLILEAFNLRFSIPVETGELDDDEVDQLENVLIESVVSMTLKLNDTIFRPFFAQLVDQVSSSTKQRLSNSITFCKFLAAFFERFKSIVTSYSSYIIEHAVRLLDSSVKADIPGLREAVLNALQKSFEHDQDGFWQSPSHYGTILKPLLSQLTVPISASELTGFVIPAITELANASASSIENHREMNAIFLRYMRAEEAHTRLATVKCEQSLTKKLGDEWLGLLPEMLPFISELREDDDEMVERETQRWITMMEEILGEDLEAMLQ